MSKIRLTKFAKVLLSLCLMATTIYNTPIVISATEDEKIAETTPVDNLKTDEVLSEGGDTTEAETEGDEVPIEMNTEGDQGGNAGSITTPTSVPTPEPTPITTPEETLIPTPVAIPTPIEMNTEGDQGGNAGSITTPTSVPTPEPTPITTPEETLIPTPVAIPTPTADVTESGQGDNNGNPQGDMLSNPLPSESTVSIVLPTQTTVATNNPESTYVADEFKVTSEVIYSEANDKATLILSLDTKNLSYSLDIIAYDRETLTVNSDEFKVTSEVIYSEANDKATLILSLDTKNLSYSLDIIAYDRETLTVNSDKTNINANGNINALALDATSNGEYEISYAVSDIDTLETIDGIEAAKLLDSSTITLSVDNIKSNESTPTIEPEVIASEQPELMIPLTPKPLLMNNNVETKEYPEYVSANQLGPENFHNHEPNVHPSNSRDNCQTNHAYISNEAARNQNKHYVHISDGKSGEITYVRCDKYGETIDPGVTYFLVSYYNGDKKISEEPVAGGANPQNYPVDLGTGYWTRNSKEGTRVDDLSNEVITASTDYYWHPEEVKSFTITTEVVNGTISKPEEVKGGDVTVTYSPKSESYVLDKIVVDGSEIKIDNTNTSSYTFTDVKENHTISVSYRPLNKYTVTYTDGYEGRNYFETYTEELLEGSSIPTNYPEHSRENYEIVGWKTQDGSDVPSVISEDITLVAQWESTKEKVDVTNYPEHSRENYEIVGWKTQDGSDVPSVISEDITLVAQWESTKEKVDVFVYTLITGNVPDNLIINNHDYYTIGRTKLPLDKATQNDIDKNIIKNVSLDNLSIERYEPNKSIPLDKIKWVSLHAANGADDYQPGGYAWHLDGTMSYEDLEHVTIPIYFHLNYDFDNNGSDDIDQFTFIKASTFPSYPNNDKLVRNGYTFGGWYLDEQFITPYVPGEYSSPEANEYNVYAKWIPNNLTITVNYVMDNEGRTPIAKAETIRTQFNKGYDVTEYKRDAIKFEGYNYVLDSIDGALTGTVTEDVVVTFVYSLDEINLHLLRLLLSQVIQITTN